MVAARSAAAAPFVNLGFDAAITDSVMANGGPDDQGIGSARDLLPGWSFTKGGVPEESLGLNLLSLSHGSATLISANQSANFRFEVEGAFALLLMGVPGNQQPFRLAQTGAIPENASSLTYHYKGFPMLVSLNGEIMQPVSQDPGKSQTFDISAFSGRNVDLLFTTTGPLMPTEAGSTYLDSISFNVPEPSTTALMTMGALLVGWRSLRREARWSL